MLLPLPQALQSVFQRNVFQPVFIGVLGILHLVHDADRIASINICDGCRLGFVGDVEVLLPEGRVAALVVPLAKSFVWLQRGTPRQSRGFFIDGQSPMLLASASRRASTV